MFPPIWWSSPSTPVITARPRRSEGIDGREWSCAITYWVMAVAMCSWATEISFASQSRRISYCTGWSRSW
jgi:hypothetical protein